MNLHMQLVRGLGALGSGLVFALIGVFHAATPVGPVSTCPAGAVPTAAASRGAALVIPVKLHARMATVRCSADLRACDTAAPREIMPACCTWSFINPKFRPTPAT